MARSWLPIGSVVTLKDGVRPVMVVAVMAQDSKTGKWWDYMGYPYPEGMGDAETDYFFDALMIFEKYSNWGWLMLMPCCSRRFCEGMSPSTFREAWGSGWR